MSIWLRYGNRSYEWNDEEIFRCAPVLAPPPWARCESLWQAEERAKAPGRVEPSGWLDHLVDALPAARRSVVVVIPDHTRTGPWQRLLAPLLARLGAHTAGPKTLLIATGTHKPSRPEALAHLGASGWDVIENSAEGFSGHRLVGTTRAGTSVRLHPQYLDAECRIVLGEVSYHYFAGYGGAPKLVFPGLAEPEGAAHNHRRALLPGPEWNPACGPGLTAGNPVHEDLLEAAAFAPPSWAVLADTVPGEQPDPACPEDPSLFVLQGRDVREEACRSLDRRSRIAFEHAPELLVADAGGTPRDDSLLQAHKSLQHGVRFLSPGGRLLLAARCADGYASDGLAILARRGWDALNDGALGPLHQQTAVALRDATRRIRVALWSDLPSTEVERLGLEPITSGTEAERWARSDASQSWGWIPRVERFLPAEKNGDGRRGEGHTGSAGSGAAR